MPVTISIPFGTALSYSTTPVPAQVLTYGARGMPPPWHSRLAHHLVAALVPTPGHWTLAGTQEEVPPSAWPGPRGAGVARALHRPDSSGCGPASRVSLEVRA